MARHRWIRVRVHVYICQRCGCGRVNEQRRGGEWVTTFHRPDGTSQSRPTPPCLVGPKTGVYLRKYETAIGVGGLPKEKHP